MPNKPLPKPEQFLKVLDILNTKDAANMIDPKSYADMVGQYAFKAYKNDELSYRDYLGIVKPLFGKAGEMVSKKIEERDKYLERYATGGRVKYSDGSDEPDISKLKEKIIELMDTDNLTFEEAYREAREEGYAAGGRVNFYKGSSAVKSHGAEIKTLTEAGESSVTIAKKLGLAQQTVNAAMDAMDKGIAGEEFKLSKPRKDIIKLNVNQTGVNLKDPKHVEEVIQWIDDNPKANQKDAMKIFGKRKAQLVDAKFYGSPGKKWNDEKVKLKNKARLELTKLRSSPSLEAELGAPKKSGLNFHHAGFKESLADLKNTMYIPGSPNRKMAKLFEDPLLKQMETFTKVFDDIDASPLEKQKAATNYLKNDRALRQKYPEFKNFKTRLSFRRTSLDPSGIMFKEKLPDPNLAISNEPGMTLKGETPSTNKGKEIIKKAAEKYGKYAKQILKPVTRLAAPFVPFAGPVMVGLGASDVAEAAERGYTNPDELGIAYLAGPELAGKYAQLKQNIKGQEDETESFVP